MYSLACIQLMIFVKVHCPNCLLPEAGKKSLHCGEVNNYKISCIHGLKTTCLHKNNSQTIFVTDQNLHIPHCTNIDYASCLHLQRELEVITMNPLVCTCLRFVTLPAAWRLSSATIMLWRSLRLSTDDCSWKGGRFRGSRYGLC